MTRMTEAQEREREAMENALALIARALVLLETQVALRLRQAVRRWPGDLLAGAVECEAEAEQALRAAQRWLGELWRRRTQMGWQDCSSKETRKVRKFTRGAGAGARGQKTHSAQRDARGQTP